MHQSEFPSDTGRLLAVCISDGGVPKLPIEVGQVTAEGLTGDRHAHAKHVRPDRALSLFDREVIDQLVREGYALGPGIAGENLTVEGLDIQHRPEGTLVEIGDVLIRLEKPRKPCYVLDVIDPRLKDVIVGRCGYMASVIRGGELRAGMTVRCLPAREPAGAAE